MLHRIHFIGLLLLSLSMSYAETVGEALAKDPNYFPANRAELMEVVNDPALALVFAQALTGHFAVPERHRHMVQFLRSVPVSATVMAPFAEKCAAAFLDDPAKYNEIMAALLEHNGTALALAYPQARTAEIAALQQQEDSERAMRAWQLAMLNPDRAERQRALIAGQSLAIQSLLALPEHTHVLGLKAWLLTSLNLAPQRQSILAEHFDSLEKLTISGMGKESYAWEPTYLRIATAVFPGGSTPYAQDNATYLEIANFGGWVDSALGKEQSPTWPQPGNSEDDLRAFVTQPLAEGAEAFFSSRMSDAKWQKYLPAFIAILPPEYRQKAIAHPGFKEVLLQDMQNLIAQLAETEAIFRAQSYANISEIARVLAHEGGESEAITLALLALEPAIEQASWADWRLPLLHSIAPDNKRVQTALQQHINSGTTPALIRHILQDTEWYAKPPALMASLSALNEPHAEQVLSFLRAALIASRGQGLDHIADPLVLAGINGKNRKQILTEYSTLIAQAAFYKHVDGTNK